MGRDEAWGVMRMRRRGARLARVRVRWRAAGCVRQGRGGTGLVQGGTSRRILWSIRARWVLSVRPPPPLAVAPLPNWPQSRREASPRRHARRARSSAGNGRALAAADWRARRRASARCTCTCPPRAPATHHEIAITSGQPSTLGNHRPRAVSHPSQLGNPLKPLRPPI